MTNKFIVFEGMAYGGKTKQIKRLKKHFKNSEYKVEFTEEPTKFVYGKKVRKLIEIAGKDQHNLLILLELTTLDRGLHQAYIEKTLKKSNLISERYILTDIAHLSALGVDEDTIEWYNEYFIKPNLIIYFDITIDKIFKGLGKKERALVEQSENFERIKSFYESVRNNYLKYLNLNRNIIPVDASESPQILEERLILLLEQEFTKN